MLSLGIDFWTTASGGVLGSPNAWMLPGAGVDMDFANGRYFGDTLANLITVARASSKTNLLPASASGFAYSTFLSNVLAVTPGSGALIEEARTNVLLNSAAPVTQTTASLAVGTYTLWVNGSGSATPSAGTATITGAGLATNGAPDVFVVTVAGTVTVTVAGALNAFQCELGAFGTSFIPTAGAPATRAVDNVTLGAVPNGLWTNQSAGWVAMRAVGPNQIMGTTSSRLLSTNADAAQLGISGLSGNVGYVARSGAVSTANAYTANTSLQLGSSWNAATALVSLNQGTVVSGATAAFTGGATNLGNRSDLTRSWNGTIQRLTFGSASLSAAQVQALSP